MSHSKTKPSITDTIADWIDTHVIAEAIDNALKTAELPRTVRHFREVWFVHLQYVWQMLETHAAYLKEYKQREARLAKQKSSRTLRR